MAETIDAPTNAQKFAAELIGTFVLVFFGVGAALMSGGDYVATGLTFGLTVVVMAYAVGRISGGHFNPAVTLGASLGGRLPWRETGLYMASQLIGALVAGACLFGLMHGFPGFDAKGNMGQNSFGDAGSGYAWWAALLLEALLTMVFLWVILAVTDERNELQALMGPLAIGFALAMIHFASMTATGTSVNPARSIGVGVFAGTEAISQLWLFIVAPLLGGALAGLTYPVIFGHGAGPVPGSGLSMGGRPKDAPMGYEAQWNQGQPTPWDTQQWGAPHHGGQQQQPQPQQPGQWGQQGDPYARPHDPYGQQPARSAPQQWGAPPQQPVHPPQGQPQPQGQPPHPQPGQPGHWGSPEGDDDGRTQVRRPD